MRDSMKVEWWPIGEVIPYENNPRDNDDAVEPLANSIREFGWRQPIVVDADGVIIAGHTRLKAAKRLGLEQVPVHVASDLTAAQAAAYRLADNKTAELADWDMDALFEELDGLTVDFDMSQFGFDMHGFDLSQAVGELSDAMADGSADVEHRTLKEQFGFVPFSVIRGDAADWLDRKAQWLALGIRSEIGRGWDLLSIAGCPSRRASYSR